MADSDSSIKEITVSAKSNAHSSSLHTFTTMGCELSKPPSDTRVVGTWIDFADKEGGGQEGGGRITDADNEYANIRYNFNLFVNIFPIGTNKYSKSHIHGRDKPCKVSGSMLRIDPSGYIWHLEMVGNGGKLARDVYSGPITNWGNEDNEGGGGSNNGNTVIWSGCCSGSCCCLAGKCCCCPTNGCFSMEVEIVNDANNGEIIALNIDGRKFTRDTKT